MSQPAMTLFVRNLRRPEPRAASGPADHELLEHFATRGDEAAFAALVERHGPLVRGLCRRLLGDPGMADDVFQATFFVLARRAGSIRRRESVGSWLFGVAQRLGRKAQRGAARRRRHERQAAEGRPRGRSADAGWAELLAILDEELARLPEQARAPLLLCYLEGCTQDEAARSLGWSVGTLRRRLEWARDLLRRRMTRRGATLSAGLCAALLAPHPATASVPPSLIGATARAAAQFASGRAPRTAAAKLAGSASSALWPRLLKGVALALLSLGVVTAALDGWAFRAADERPADPRPAETSAPDSQPAAAKALEDPLGDPLPEGALVRFGSTRFNHPGGINGSALAPDGKLLATEGGHCLRLIDTTTGRVRLTLPDNQIPEGYNDGQRVLAFSPDGKSLLVPGPNAVRLLDVATGKETRQLPGPAEPTRGVAFSPDGKQVAVSDGGGATFYEAATGKRQHQIPLAGGWSAWWLEYAPDGRTVALPGATESMIRLCDTATGVETRNFENGSEVLSAVFAPDGKTLAAVSKDRTVRLWNVGAGKEVQALAEGPAERDRDQPAALAFAPDGKILAAARKDSAIDLWDLSTGKALRRLKGHTWMVTGLFFSRDGKTLLSTSWDRTVRRWDVASGKEIRGPENDLDQTQMARSPDGKLLATGGADGPITLWETATGRRLRVLEGHRRGLFALAFSPDGRRLASGGWERAVRVWDVASGKEERALDCAPPQKPQGRIEAVAFSPDGRLLAAGDSDQDVIHLWDVGNGGEVQTLPYGQPVALAFAPDGKTLAAGGWDRTLVVWDVATGGKVYTIEPGERNVGPAAIAFSPDGKLIATGNHGAPVYLWKAATGKFVREIEAGHEVTWCLAFSPDGNWLATGGLDHTVRLWEVATGRRMHQLRGHEFWVLRLAFGPDGKTLTTGGYDGTSLLWTLKPKLEPLPAAGVESLWKTLGEEDAAGAYHAVWTLAEHPDQSMPFLKKRLCPPEPAIDKDRLRQWLADLDSSDFQTREAASRELAKLGLAIEPNLRAALAKAESVEARRRLERLLEDLRSEQSAEALQRSRAVRVLELIGSRDGEELLQTLRKGR
jgi:RNA polymerase sigma factor (sigma-70 family)